METTSSFSKGRGFFNISQNLKHNVKNAQTYLFGNAAGVIREYTEGKMPAGVADTFHCAYNRGHVPADQYSNPRCSK